LWFLAEGFYFLFFGGLASGGLWGQWEAKMEEGSLFTFSFLWKALDFVVGSVFPFQRFAPGCYEDHKRQTYH